MRRYKYIKKNLGTRPQATFTNYQTKYFYNRTNTGSIFPPGIYLQIIFSGLMKIAKFCTILYDHINKKEDTKYYKHFPYMKMEKHNSEVMSKNNNLRWFFMSKRNAEYEFYQDNDKNWRWRVTASNGNIIGASIQGFTNKNDCEYNFVDVKTSLKEFDENDEELLYKDSKDEWRWRVKNCAGTIIGKSSEGYINRSDCLHNVEILIDGMTI